tara:strand:+ start:326 stop:835 length:510 start_codon:yes stop_codon:yes gene_type:complete
MSRSLFDSEILGRLAAEGDRLRKAEDAEVRPKKRQRPTLFVAAHNSAKQEAQNEKFVKEGSAELNIHEVNRKANAQNRAIQRYQKAAEKLRRYNNKRRERVKRRRQLDTLPPLPYDSGAETDVMPPEPISDLRNNSNFFKQQLPALPEDGDDADIDTSPPTDVASALRF